MTRNREDIIFGRKAIFLGYIQKEQVSEYLNNQAEQVGEYVPLPQWLVKKGYLSISQVQTIQSYGKGEVPSTMKKPAPKNKRSSSSDQIGKNAGESSQSVFGRYKIIEELGRGGMGVVYKAYDPHLDRIVGLKILIPKETGESIGAERIIREAKAIAKLHHPNIVMIYDIGNEGDRPFFTMDFIDGISLEKRLQQSSLTVRQIIDILTRVGNAVYYAHTQGVIHRDLTPANVMLDHNNDPKVMDFGLAKVVRESHQLSKTGAIIGTPFYMSPEQADGKTYEIDERTDVYALGGLLYTMLTGRTPFTANTLGELVIQIMTKDPIPPSRIRRSTPRRLEQICLKALEKNKKRRYQSAAQFVEALQDFSQGKPTSAHAVGDYALKSWKNPKFLVSAVAVLMLLFMPFLFSNSKPQSDVVVPFQMSVRAVDESKTPREKFVIGSPIQIEVKWQRREVSSSAQEQVFLHGKGIKPYNRTLAKADKTAKIRQKYCPVELISRDPGRFTANIQVQVGDMVQEKRVTFYVGGRDPADAMKISVKVVGEDKKERKQFMAGDPIQVEVSRKSKGPEMRKVEIYGEGIRYYKWESSGSEDKEQPRYYPIKLIDSATGRITATVKLETEKASREQKVHFEVKPPPVTLFTIRPHTVNRNKEKQDRFVIGEPIQLELSWHVTEVRSGAPVEVEVYGDNTRLYKWQSPEPVHTGDGKIYCPIEVVSPEEGRYAVTAKVEIAGIQRKRRAWFYLQPEQGPEASFRIRGRLLDKNRNIRNTYVLGEEIQAEVAWQVKKISSRAEVEVDLYGQQVRYYKWRSGEPAKKGVQRIFCPVTVLSNKTGKFSITIQVKIGEVSRQKHVRFYIKLASQTSVRALFRGHLGRKGAYSDRDIDELKGSKWKFKTGFRVRSSPTVKRGIVYFGSDDGYFYAVDARSGAGKWKFKTGAAVFSSPALVDGVAYFGSYDRYFYAVNVKNGKEKRKFRTGAGVVSSPLVFKGIAYFGSLDGILYSVDVKTFNETGKFRTGAAVFSSPATNGKTLYFGGFDNHFYAIDIETGQKKWKFKTDYWIRSTPTIADGKVYFGGDGSDFYALDMKTGKVVWKFDTESKTTCSPAVADGKLFFGTENRYLYALDSSSGRLKWKYQAGGAVFSSPAIVDDTVYFGCDDRHFYAIDRDRGRIKWKFKTGGAIWSSPTVADGVVYFGSDDGHLYALH